MITVDNLKKVLEELHYTKEKSKEIYEKNMILMTVLSRWILITKK